MSDGELGVLSCAGIDGEDQSCKDIITNGIGGEDVEGEVSVDEIDGHENKNGDCAMGGLTDGVRRYARDLTHAHGEDTFCDTGYPDESEIDKHSVGVRGPRNVSVLFPHDCNKCCRTAAVSAM